MAAEGIRIEGEGEGSSQSPQLVEERAKAKGWKPREESDLPDEQWIDAREFLGRQPLFDQIHSLKREMQKQTQGFQRQMAEVSLHFSRMQDVEFEKAMKTLKAEKKLALEDKDIVAVEAINEEIKEKEKEQQALKQAIPRPAPNQINEEFNEWREQNKWFNEDPVLQKEAIQIGTGYALTNKDRPQAEVLEYTLKTIKRLYPEKFQTQRKEPMTSKVESGEGTGNSGFSDKKSKGLTKADLSEQELSVMRTLVKQNVLKDVAAKNKVTQEQQYLNDLAEAKGLK